MPRDDWYSNDEAGAAAHEWAHTDRVDPDIPTKAEAEADEADCDD